MTLTEQQERFLRECLLVLEELGDTLSAGERAEVKHFFNHSEIGEGLRALLWIIVEEHKSVPEATIDRILELGDGLIEVRHLPDRFRQRLPR